MKKTTLLILAIILLNLYIFAQDDKTQTKPDFSGTWIFDEKASTLKRNLYKNYTLVISHLEPEIKIKRSALYMDQKKFKDLILYTDKRGEKNHPFFTQEDPEVKSKTFWKKDTLISEYKQRTVVAGIEFLSESIDKYNLSEDKKTLTITSLTRFIFPSESRFNKWIFRKQE